MPISVGARLGAYEITALLGEGGMGRVFRARDTRDVAVKALPDEFARDPDRVARFRREAEALAALNHSHIAGIHDLLDSDGSQFLILELVEGETLADRIAHGSSSKPESHRGLPVDEALGFAKQIADALEAAHERGIVHRDLKPANIKITTDGRVKVLDFGLAKFREVAGTTSSLTHSPTMMTAAAGVILGTAAYMSPEQARGKETDRTTDVWAFGCLAATIRLGSNSQAVEAGTPVALFHTRMADDKPNPNKHQYAVAPDGQHFLINNLPEEAAASAITLVLNWKPPVH